MKTNKKAPAPTKATRADNRKQSHSFISTVSRYQQKQYERPALGQALIAALQGGQL